MQSIWPSAWRAYQLLQGSKVRPQELRPSVSPPVSDRRKRSADHAALEQHLSDSIYRESQNYARPSPSTGQPQQGYSMGIDIPPTEPPAFFPQFERWGPDGNAVNNFPVSTLSTSVLPQQFSTGFVDERSQRNSDRAAQRFPQYWSDYSSLGQMDSAYSVPPNEMVSSNPGPSPPRPPQQSVVYPQDQFLVFSECPSPLNETYADFEHVQITYRLEVNHSSIPLAYRRVLY